MLKSLINKTPVYLYFKFLLFRLKKQNKNNDELCRNFFSQFIGKGDLCFDVGANIGNKSGSFLSLGAKVVAIEPQNYCYKFLKLRFRNKIIIRKVALGAKKHVASIHLNDENTISSLSLDWIKKVKEKRFRNFIWDKTEEVEVTTLDDLITEYGTPKFCKIDVEGYEYEVLQGLNTKIELISFEFAWPESLELAAKCLEHLQELGDYKCNYSEGENMKLRYKQWIPGNEFIARLPELKTEETDWGDIYIKFN